MVLLANASRRETREVLESWTLYLAALGRSCEILIVGAGTEELPPVGSAEAPPLVRALHETAALEPGPALQRGIDEARFPLLLLTSATRVYFPCDLKLLLDAIDKVHLAVGVPTFAGHTLWRTWRQWLYHFGLRWIFGIRLRDVECPFKLFRREIFSRIPLQAHGPFMHAEILAKANFLGFVILEVPIAWMAQPADSAPGFDWRGRCRDAYRLFRHPDFGPTLVTKPTSIENVGDEVPLSEGGVE